MLIGGFIYFNYDPTSSILFPKCPVYAISGIKCMGCGSQRAIYSLLNLDILSALKYNGVLVLSIPFIIVLLYAELVKNKQAKFYRKVNNRWVIMTTLIVIIAWTVARNIFNC